MDFP